MEQDELLNKAMEKFAKYDEFVQFDETQIEERLLELPKTINYYQNMFYSLSDKYSALENEMESHWQDLFVYYKNGYDITLSNSEIKMFIERDAKVLDYKRRMSRIKILADKAEDVVKSLREMSWTLKHIIEYKKFKAGIV